MRFLVFCLTLLFPNLLVAEGNRAGEFDYYVLSLSWTPSWCEIEGDERASDQCDARHDFGWTLHGLWPQYHQGWPLFCNTAARPPSRAMTRDMADIMGSAGLAWHQWKKHGSCSGLSARAYFELSRDAYDMIMRPDVFRKLDKTVTLPASLVEEAFIKDNPDFDAEMITITCRNRRIQEARFCLSKSLDPVPCSQDAGRDCQMKDALFAPIR